MSNPSGTPPTITLGNPYPALNAIITAPTTLTATVSDDHVGVSYVLQAIPFDGTPATTISSGSTSTQNTLTFTATFDPTMLADGDFTLELRATDTDDNLTTVNDEYISLQGHLKLGREQLSVTDLTIPVAGIPITITRSYGAARCQEPFRVGRSLTGELPGGNISTCQGRSARKPQVGCTMSSTGPMGALPYSPSRAIMKPFSVCWRMRKRSSPCGCFLIA